MTVVDSDPGKAGRLHSSNAADYAIRNNGGTLSIESGYLSGANGVIYSTGSEAVVNMSGGTIEGVKYGIYAGNNVNITGGTINCSSSANNSYGIYNSSKTTTISGGEINVTTTGSSAAYGSYGGTTILNDTAVINVTSATGTAMGIYFNTVVNGGEIHVTSNSTDAYGVYSSGGDNGTAIVNGGIITVTNTSQSTSGGIIAGVTGGRIKINGGQISATSTKRTVHGVNAWYSVYLGSTYGSIEITGGEISASSTDGTAYGVGHSSSYMNNFTMTNGTVEASSTNGTSYGIQLGQTSNNAVRTIVDGTIKGGTYGVYTNNSSRIIIGNNEDAVSITTPEITGGNYALYGQDANIEFYDGILHGGTKAYNDGTITAIADNTAPHIEYQTIDGISYHTIYLGEEHWTAIIGNDKYTSLKNAISHVRTNETIDLIDDNYIFEALTISAEKDFTINTNGYYIHINNPITNNGKLTIIGPTNDRVLFEYYSAQYLFTNNTGAELTLNNINIATTYGINNSGTFNIEHATINASKTAIQNTGIATSNNISLRGDSYSYYNDGGQSLISDSIITGKAIYNNSGELSINNSTATKVSASEAGYTTNNGTLNINSSSVSFTSTSRYTNNNSTVTRAIYSSSILSITNGSTVEHITTDSSSGSYAPASSVYNDGGSAFIANSNIVLDTTGMRTYTDRNAYGIYNPTGSLNIESGTVSSRALGKSYGLYTDSGTIIIGTPEPADSPNYGGANADVSTTSPDISAISTSTDNSYRTGIGVENASGGRVEYYDGKVSGNTAAFAEEPTVTEHFYEVCTEQDTTTTPNLYTAKLFWMRDGQSSCGNN